MMFGMASLHEELKLRQLTSTTLELSYDDDDDEGDKKGEDLSLLILRSLLYALVIVQREPWKELKKKNLILGTIVIAKSLVVDCVTKEERN